MKWGIKPDNNILALKGKWIGTNRFFMEFQEVGEPFYFDIEVHFIRNKIEACFTWKPLGRKFILEGDYR